MGRQTMAKGNLYRDFIYPPFSVLDARAGWWQDRKKTWLELGIQSHAGRQQDLLSGFGNAMRLFNGRKGKEAIAPEWAGLSVFDPVLCELLYAWFSPKGGVVLDPFAGGSVRGLVAGAMGRRYIGIDLSAEQIAANQAQLKGFPAEVPPRWILGNSTNLYRHTRCQADFLFSCPPYGDLERYSNDPQDLSNMPYDIFIGSIRAVVKQAGARLKDNRFAAFVVGDFRDRSGIYRGFVRDTIDAFKDAGLLFYNDAVLVTQAASLPLRARSAFEASRKLGKTHQNVLVFVKGDPARARQEIGDVKPCSLFAQD